MNIKFLVTTASVFAIGALVLPYQASSLGNSRVNPENIPTYQAQTQWKLGVASDRWAYAPARAASESPRLEPVAAQPQTPAEIIVIDASSDPEPTLVTATLPETPDYAHNSRAVRVIDEVQPNEARSKIAADLPVAGMEPAPTSDSQTQPAPAPRIKRASPVRVVSPEPQRLDRGYYPSRSATQISSKPRRNLVMIVGVGF